MWLSLAFGHISEWSIQSDRDKLAVTKEEPTTQKNHTFKLWFRNNMPFRASHCPGVRNANTRAKWSLWCGCRGNVLNVLSYGDQGHEAMEIPQRLSVDLVSIKLTVRPWHSLRVLLLERGNSQNQNKAKSSWGFGTHFSYPLSEKVWLKTSDILPVGKDVYFWLYIFFGSLSPGTYTLSKIIAGL